MSARPCDGEQQLPDEFQWREVARERSRGEHPSNTRADVSTAATSDSLLLTIRQTCEMLQVSRTRLFAMFAAGELPRLKLGKTTRVRRADVEEYVAGL